MENRFKDRVTCRRFVELCQDTLTCLEVRYDLYVFLHSHVLNPQYWKEAAISHLYTCCDRLSLAESTYEPEKVDCLSRRSSLCSK